MTATMMIHDIEAPVAQMADKTSWLKVPTTDGGYAAIFMPYHVAEAMAAAYAAASVPGYDALLGFVEEVRDCRPDQQGVASDMIDAEVFWAFQDDAETLIGKKDAA